MQGVFIIPLRFGQCQEAGACGLPSFDCKVNQQNIDRLDSSLDRSKFPFHAVNAVHYPPKSGGLQGRRQQVHVNFSLLFLLVMHRSDQDGAH